jgi:hypothetical protein
VATTIALVDQAYNTFVGNANVTIGGGTVGGANPVLNPTTHECDKTAGWNWGDPEHSLPYTSGGTTTYPCGSYYPIVHVTGDLRVTGHVGQGILLVDGNLTAGGGFTFYGLVIVKGSVQRASGASNFFGGLLAEAPGSTDDLTGNTTIQYSSCAINTAVASVAVARPMAQRAFIQY